MRGNATLQRPVLPALESCFLRVTRGAQGLKELLSAPARLLQRRHVVPFQIASEGGAALVAQVTLSLQNFSSESRGGVRAWRAQEMLEHALRQTRKALAPPLERRLARETSEEGLDLLGLRWQLADRARSMGPIQAFTHS